MKPKTEAIQDALRNVRRDFVLRPSREPEAFETPVAPEVDDRVRAFVTEANGRTILTAPAGAAVPDFEKALSPNPYFLHVQGAFVGSEKANRNGALWTAGDLEFGEPTVRYGPLNWLHEDRKVIGAVADAKLIQAPPDGSREAASSPYIAAAAVVWKWLWPQESQVIEHANDSGQLWYSMECISRRVDCVDHGCGDFAYLDAQRAAEGVCEHVARKTGTRRFIDPVFLGGAMIVPPVRPGWADAHARLMEAAAEHAPATFDQAGKPNVEAGEWERMMALVLGFAGLED